MRRITFLEKITEADASPHFRFAFWCDVPAARQASFLKGPLPPGASFVTAINDGSVTAAEQAALTNGSVIEVVIDRRFEPGRGAAAVQTALQAAFTAAQADIAAWNPWVRYGSTFDDAGAGTWTAKGVA